MRDRLIYAPIEFKIRYCGNGERTVCAFINGAIVVQDALSFEEAIRKLDCMLLGVKKENSKVGDKVYMRFEGEITPLTIIRISTLETVDGVSRHYEAKSKIVATSFTDCHIGKTVFLTKEEAEKALKEKENG